MFLILALVSTLHQIVVEAVINLPNFGNRTYVKKGSDVRIPWTFDDDISNVLVRKWSFKNTSIPDFEPLGIIFRTGNYDVDSKSPFTTEVTKPATLSVKNANLHHGGTYRFEITLRFGIDPPDSHVLVIMREQPTAVTNCSQTPTVNEGEDFTCLCESKGGNPPPNASWVKNGKTVVSGYLKAILSLKNVNRTDAGSYTCKVASHDVTNENVVKLTVNFAPKENGMRFPAGAILNKEFTITCESKGSPEPKFKLFHNDSELTVGGSARTYTIKSVKDTDAGEYKCVAENNLGKAEKKFTLTVTESAATSAVTTMPPTATRGGNSNGYECSRGTSGSEWYIVFVTLIGGIVIGMVLMYGILFLRRRGNKSEGDDQRSVPSRNDESRGDENIPYYQELDATKRDAGDNYQSLRITGRNPRSYETSVGNEAGYQELNEVRGNRDDNYQSLNPQYVNTS